MGRRDAVQTTLEIVAECRRLLPGLIVTYEPGWERRGNGLSANYVGGIVHHTASLSSLARPFPTQGILRDGRSDLPGPLCNFAGPWCSVERPRLHVMAAFPANHAGASGGRSMGPLPRTNLFNPCVVGLEIDYAGNAAMSFGQLVVGKTWTRAVANALAGGNVEFVRAHMETSITGKWDPGFAPGKTYDMAEWRRHAAAVSGPAPKPISPEDEDMPQVISTSVAPGQNAVVNIAPSGGVRDGKFVPGGAAGFGQAFASFVGDCFDKPRVPIKARIGILGGNGLYRPAFGTAYDTTLTPGKRAAVVLAPGDVSIVVTAYDYPVGVCVEYAKAPA